MAAQLAPKVNASEPLTGSPTWVKPVVNVICPEPRTGVVLELDEVSISYDSLPIPTGAPFDEVALPKIRYELSDTALTG